jgi:hypothetical protein
MVRVKPWETVLKIDLFTALPVPATFRAHGGPGSSFTNLQSARLMIAGAGRYDRRLMGS